MSILENSRISIDSFEVFINGKIKEFISWRDICYDFFCEIKIVKKIKNNLSVVIISSKNNLEKES